MICQITALPRSGTAFIATMMNLAPNCLTFHEAFVDGPNWRQRIADASKSYDVVCDVGTYQYLPKATLLDSTKVYIRNHPERSRLRSQAAFGYKIPSSAMESLHKAAEKWAFEFCPLVIDGEELFTMDALKMLWEHCNPSAPFPSAKVFALLQMNVQRANPKRVFSREAFVGRGGELWEQ
jgi:hypothetical protein